ncbi:lysine transporter LysE [Arthrobacter sp. SRS-W-1-2016]|jgi:threonine/homoserine/homoserine lactone efflux protein|uniref:LysE family translocator n=1 Tax=Arthrobacter sp. SRS-W-1-2016 TaxID=1930254 RepID=UPI000990E9C3|nr:LysE family translocator [Arthrobacter sp. SRS-W-1-2016]OOP59468.1 lysine transporter LysE [Arthrobacter sp. SRS-W-1-2016]
MTLSSLAAFTGLCVILALTPGPDSFLVLRYSLSNVKAGLSAGLGSSLGSIFWAGLVGIGLAALLEQSAEAYRVVKIIGGLYLVYLGVSAFIHSRRGQPAHQEENHPWAGPTLRSSFFAGLVSCMLNPKVGLFFLAVVPQFLPPGEASLGLTMILGVIDFAISMLYLGILSVVATKAVLWLKKPSVTKALERSSAAILTALGLGTAVSANS